MELTTSGWQPDNNGIAEPSPCHRQAVDLTNGSTLTDGRTDLRTTTKTRKLRLVPDAAGAVDKSDSPRHRAGATKFRVRVACINWPHPAPAPHAMAYVLRDGEMIADTYFATWAEAMEYAVPLARRLAGVAS